MLETEELHKRQAGRLQNEVQVISVHN
jgi:hypothetical protein